jgi:hypothetical protein
MIFSDVREEIAAALNTVGPLTGYENTPTIFSTGDAWPRWRAMDAQGAPSLFVVTWEIIVVTGGTPSDAEAYAEEHLQDILGALAEVAYVTSVAPTVIQTSSGDLYGVVITAVRE